MSNFYYDKIGGLRFWSEQELERRDSYVNIISGGVSRTLQGMNPAFVMYRVEGPILTPENFINEEYKDEDIFKTDHKRAGKTLCLRAETTASTYKYAKNTQGIKKPFCLWQVGKSFRTESNDGASPSKLRYNEFNQLEFQIVYAKSTKADYREKLINFVSEETAKITGTQTRVVESDRTPSYSDSTLDIECFYNNSFKEVASCSIRHDYDENSLVCEIAIGLDRVIEISNKEKS